ncbi:MAG: glycosyltransferase family 1 protein [Methylococcus sp.]|nr:glycosyltransferase family 1 protein [Methylococcus sp.]
MVSVVLGESGVPVLLNVDAIKPPLTGIGRYALELMRGLNTHPGVSGIRFFSGFGWVENPEAALAAHRGLISLGRKVPFKSIALQSYLWARNKSFLFRSGSVRDYLLHSPNYLLISHKGPTVSTVHDLSWHHAPQDHPFERVRVMERSMPKVFEEATRLITDSEYVRQELIRYFGVAPERVTAIPLGVSSMFSPGAASRNILGRYGLDGVSYILSVATLEPRKNLARLLDAYRSLPPSVTRRHPLVLVGGKGWGRDVLGGAVSYLEQRGGVKRLGFVPEVDIPAIYAGAQIFAYVSKYEGFGLPLVEAMASGVPVLASDASSIPEVVGDSALLVDPLDEKNIANGLSRLLEDAELRSRLKRKGLLRAAEFSWGSCIDQTVKVYHRAYREHVGGVS